MNALLRLHPAVLLVVAGCATAPARVEKAEVVQVAASAHRPSAAHADPLPAVPFKEPEDERVLASGLRVVVVEHHRRPLVAVRLIFPAGATSETDAEGGLTYLSFGLLGARFDRKTQLGEPEVFDEKSARRQVAEAGGQLQVRVSAETASMGVDGYSKDAFELLRRCWTGSFATDATGRTRSPTGATGSSTTSTTSRWATTRASMQFVAQRAFGPGHPYARPVYGSTQSLSDMALDQVVERQNRLLRPAGAILLVAGDVKPEAAFRRPPTSSDSGRRAPVCRQPKIPAPVVTKRKSVMLVHRTPARTTMVCAARPLTDVKAPDAALEVLAQVLGSKRLRDA